jgi:hypothetical protein
MLFDLSNRDSIRGIDNKNFVNQVLRGVFELQHLEFAFFDLQQMIPQGRIIVNEITPALKTSAMRASYG